MSNPITAVLSLSHHFCCDKFMCFFPDDLVLHRALKSTSKKGRVSLQIYILQFKFKISFLNFICIFHKAFSFSIFYRKYCLISIKKGKKRSWNNLSKYYTYEEFPRGKSLFMYGTLTILLNRSCQNFCPFPSILIAF